MRLFTFRSAGSYLMYLRVAEIKKKKGKGKRMRINGMSAARAVLLCVGYYASSTNPFILDYRKTRYARCGSN